jgi:hypothetical protein
MENHLQALREALAKNLPDLDSAAYADTLMMNMQEMRGRCCLLFISFLPFYTN